MIINKKSHKNYSRVNTKKNHILQFGSFGFKTTNYICLTQTQFDTLIWLIKLKLKKLTKKNNAKVWVPISSNLILTKLGLESRMGKGKGAVYTTAFFLRPGNIVFEFENLSIYQTSQLLQFINKKVSRHFQLVSRFY